MHKGTTDPQQMTDGSVKLPPLPPIVKQPRSKVKRSQVQPNGHK